ncbi:MAG: DUF4136 domain-containing protein [Sphingomonadaceae bacterium]
MRLTALCAALLLAAGLAGCATSEPDAPRDGIHVTRFHLGQGPIARGQITVEPINLADANAPGFASYSAAVKRELARLGYTLTDDVPESELVAIVDVEQGSPEAIARYPGLGIGGGAAIGRSSGLGADRPEIVATLLEVRIKRRSDGTIFWEGRALDEAPAASPEAQPQYAVDKLAHALFGDFPGESGRTIIVE